MLTYDELEQKYNKLRARFSDLQDQLEDYEKDYEMLLDVITNNDKTEELERWKDNYKKACNGRKQIRKKLTDQTKELKKKDVKLASLEREVVLARAEPDHPEVLAVKRESDHLKKIMENMGCQHPSVKAAEITELPSGAVNTVINGNVYNVQNDCSESMRIDFARDNMMQKDMFHMIFRMKNTSTGNYECFRVVKECELWALREDNPYVVEDILKQMFSTLAEEMLKDYIHGYRGRY